MNNEFNILLRLHRNMLTEEEKQKPIRPVLWLYPVSTEKVYAKDISGYLKEYINTVLASLEPKLEKWIRQNKRDYKADAWEDEYKEFDEDIKKMLLLYFGTGLLFDKKIGQSIQNTSDKIMAFALLQWNKQTKAVLGTPYNSMPPDWVNIKKLWMDENYREVKGLAEEFNKKLETTIITGMLASWTYEEFAEQIQAISKKIIKSRSAFIARSQTGNLTGTIIKNYAKSVDNDEYIWQTALDEKVRGNPNGKYPKAIPSHFLMEGKFCKWSDNSVFSEDGEKWKKRTAKMETLPPGMAYNCRCTAGMYWDNFVKEKGI